MNDCVVIYPRRLPNCTHRTLTDEYQINKAILALNATHGWPHLSQVPKLLGASALRLSGSTINRQELEQTVRLHRIVVSIHGHGSAFVPVTAIRRTTVQKDHDSRILRVRFSAAC